MTPKTNNEWEKEFENFQEEMNNYNLTGTERREIFDIVRQLLSSERQRLREKISSRISPIPPPPTDTFNLGYDRALSDILKLLEE